VPESKAVPPVHCGSHPRPTGKADSPLNKTRADFAERFEELIESYNNGSRNIEELFEELVKLSRNLNDEQPSSTLDPVN
jgi:hypothetical protein